MKRTSGVPDLSDTALEDHIQHLQSKIDRLSISLDLATAEKQRRLQRSDTTEAQRKVQSKITEQHSKSLTAHPNLTIGSRVQILNKYRGNKGKIGTVAQISGKTATVNIASEGNFIKYLSNLKLLKSPR